jgi:hypothetical protein
MKNASGMVVGALSAMQMVHGSLFWALIYLTQ